MFTGRLAPLRYKTATIGAKVDGIERHLLGIFA
jgi:hypothetical protein